MNELVVRIAARGDGVTQSGRHVRFGVPGDALLDDGALAVGPHHQTPPCSLFPECGGCQLQHVDDETYRDFLSSRISTSLAQHAIETEILDPHLSPPRSRRRATLRALKIAQGALVGFNEEKSHRIVDMRECHILSPELFALVQPIRTLIGRLIPPKRSGEVQLTSVNGGIDVLIRGIDASSLSAIEELASFAAAHGLARLSVDAGAGAEIIYEPQPVTVSLSGMSVSYPVGGFLQATKDGEEALVASVRKAITGASAIADLFSGLGTFALGAGAIYCAEASRDAAAALRRAAPQMTVEHRDLYRRPLSSNELDRFDAVILDPPRAGAADQVNALARSNVSKIAYVSCNPSTFARDAKTLVDGNYSLDWVRPVGQFRWSTHVELAASFNAR